MKKIIRALFPVLFCLLPQLHAAPPVMPADSYSRCISELKTALKSGDMKAVERNAENLKKYGLQADGERIIKQAQAQNKDMFNQVKESYGYWAELREAADENSVKACGRLISNIEKKCMSDAMWELVPVFGQVKQVYDSLAEMTPHGDAPVIKGNAEAIRHFDQMRKYCDDIIKSFDTILKELKQERKLLEEAEDIYKKGASRTQTAEIKKEQKKDTRPPEKTKPPQEQKPPKDPPQTSSETKPPPAVPQGSGETTTVKGYVGDGKGKITLTETTDKNGNLIKTTYTTTDKNGKVTKVQIYGPDGKLTTDPKTAAAQAAAQATAQAAAKTAAKEAAKSVSRPPPVRTMPGGCTCP